MNGPKKYKDAVRQRLNDFIQLEGTNENAFLKECGLANGWWAAVGAPSGSSLSRIKSRYSRLNMEWLFTGIGNMYVGFDGTIKVRPTSVEPKSSDSTPQLDIVSDYEPPRPQPTPPPSPASPDMVTIPRDVYNLLLEQIHTKDATITSLCAALGNTSVSHSPTSDVLPSSTEESVTPK